MSEFLSPVANATFNPVVPLESLTITPSISYYVAIPRPSISPRALHSVWRPICSQLCAIFLGWLYLIFPSKNYWIRVFIRNQFFSILVVIGFTELQDTCMPDTTVAVYIWTYVLGVTFPPVIRVIAWFTGTQDNYFINTFIPAAPCVIVWILYGYDALLQRSSPRKSMQLSSLHDTFLIVEALSEEAAVQRHANRVPMLPIQHASNADTENENVGNNRFSSTDSSKSIPTTIPRWTTTSQHHNSASVTSSDFSSLSTMGMDNFRGGVFFWFLPRFMFFNNKSVIPRTCGDDRLVIWAFASSFVLMWVVIWEFVMNFTLLFRHYASSPRKQEILFVVFVTANNLLRMILKRIGLRNDLYKHGTTSMFFCGEALGLLFYYAFYRVLFESVTSWQVFFTLQCLHLSFEWLCYPFRASNTFLTCCKYLRSQGGVLGTFIADLFSAKYVTYEDWNKFIALDFGIRVIVVMSSGIAISLYFLSISGLYWVQNTLKEDWHKERTTIQFIVCAVVLELLNACAINVVFFKRRGVSVYNMALHAYADDRFVFITTIISAVMFLNPIYAFTTGT